MVDPTPVEGEVTQDPVEGAPKPEAPAQPFKAFATEDDYKAYEAKRAEKHEREMKALRKEMETLKATTLTEDQRAAELQKQAADAERAKMYEEATRRAGFLGVALSNRLTLDQAEKWYSLAGQEWSDPLEAFAHVQKSLGVNLETKSVAGGGGRNPDSSESVQWTPEAVEALFAKEGIEGYAKRRAEILKWQAEHYKPTGPRPLIPTTKG